MRNNCDVISFLNQAINTYTVVDRSIWEIADLLTYLFSYFTNFYYT